MFTLTSDKDQRKNLFAFAFAWCLGSKISSRLGNQPEISGEKIESLFIEYCATSLPYPHLPMALGRSSDEKCDIDAECSKPKKMKNTCRNCL